MSKKRPRHPPAEAPPDRWLGRVFRNSYTYRGARRQVQRWHVKLQHAGRRRTLTLAAASRAAAAAEAQALARRLRADGWAGIESARPRAGGDPAPRPMVRRYTAGLTPGAMQELFVRLAAEGESGCFALGTGDANLAALRAVEYQRELAAAGWRQFCLARPREATVAVVWQPNPFLCTYTTLLTVPAAQGLPPPVPAGGGWRVVILEEDGGVRRALAWWAARCPGVLQVTAAAPGVDVAPEAGAFALLARRTVTETETFQQWLHPFASRAAVLPFGVFAESDDIFASISGVSGGYFLRRRSPDRLLEPLARTRPEQGPEGLRRHARQYVQRLFAETPPDAEPPETGGLTPRETEVLDLLARGRLDKEVARALGVSVWTVHSHLRRIFAKYGVHTRTEAVVRHLQK